MYVHLLASFTVVQLNLHGICEDLHRYGRKIVFVNVVRLRLFRNNNENNFVQIFINPETVQCQMKA